MAEARGCRREGSVAIDADRPIEGRAERVVAAGRALALAAEFGGGVGGGVGGGEGWTTTWRQRGA